MDVFALRRQVLDDYHRYVDSFLNIRDRRIREFVDTELSRGVLWPDTLVQLNPSYEMGKTISDLVTEGILHPLCGKIFQRKDKTIHLYKHQEQAVRIAAKKEPYILTTGTGSGKSLTYLIPIMDHVLKNNPEPEQVRAIIVYPMNALINSQEKEIGRLLDNLGEGNSPIRFGRYTGQEGAEERDRLQKHPPHILLTNYVMLELMMSRPFERVFLDRTLANLEFLVLDELHTYTGRQGADVGMLVRRVRRRCGNENLLCVGTSATMVSGGTRNEQKTAVAEVSGKIFGVDVSPDNVTDESLRPSIRYQGAITTEILREEINKGIPGSYEDFVSNPLAAWIEQSYGIQKEDDFYKRRVPITLQEGAGQFAELTGLDNERCQDIIRGMLQKGSELKHSEDEPAFAVRLHQFISQGDTVYSTLESIDKRHVTLSAQRFAPPANGEDRLMAPLVFCRICGQEYYLVTLKRADGAVEPRMPDEVDLSEEESITMGYLLIDDDDNPVWSEDHNEDLPENWFRPTKKGRSLKREYREYVPQQVYVSADGVISNSTRGDAAGGWFIAAPFMTCLCCGEVYDKRTRRDFPKLARLSSEGRSTATTLLSISTVTRMQQDEDVEPEAQKILSFTDNRQDASLQAGHFNDFIQVGLLRSAIYLALPQGGVLDHSQIPIEVVKALNLPQNAYAQNPGEIGVQPKRNREALTVFIEYRIYQDLRRGWRIVQPNLEQCGLLKIEYDGLEDVCSQNNLWDNNTVLQAASPENRFKVVKAFLDHLRRSLALDARCLEGVYHDTLRRKVNQTLKEPWCFDDDERLAEEKWFAWGDRRPGDRSLSPISVLGKYLRHSETWEGLSTRLSVEEYEALLRALVHILTEAGYLEQELDGDDFRIQLRVDTLQWVKGEGTTVEPDPVRSVRMRSAGEKFLSREVNRFFARFYQDEALRLRELEGREHTGQTSRQDREDRENRFREGRLSSLYCSPTMELGIDIADLNTVNMRNVPPTPANYAQRSGRAGRSGQPAFISTYCSTRSGHDQYFFRRQPEMVSGVVSPPRLELTNEELVESHVHAVWLGEVGLWLGNSIADVVDLGQDSYPLLDNVAKQIELSEKKLRNCLDNCSAILGQFSKDLEAAGWYSEEWLENVVRASARKFNEAFDRWRELYKTAQNQLEQAQEALRTAHQTRLSSQEKKEAERKEREALHQKDLLCNNVRNKDDTDFYPYRYLACEGFLPGYNFPRLPVRAYVSSSGDRGGYLSRPRFLAITEYGPRNVIYHEGRKYRVVRSLVPAGDVESRFTQAKLCQNCGTFYTGDALDVDVCEHCNSVLDANNSEYIKSLFEMTTVGTQRIERISCDEEERIRYGYEITSHYRLSSEDGRERKLTAEVRDNDGNPLLNLIYGPASQLWRINRRWKRHRALGYNLDLNLGLWNRKPGDTADTALDVGADNIISGVQIFVRETKNILLIQPNVNNPLSEEELANLQHSLQKGLCAFFQIDETEIASERIGQGTYRSILFWEAAEGGLGVLKRLIEETDAMSEIVGHGLEICHFNKDAGEEIEPDVECVRACYNCLLTYRNQLDHGILNRHLIKDFLTKLYGGTTHLSYAGRSYDAHYEWLRQQTDNRSQLEKDFLDHLYREGCRLPDEAQMHVPNYPARLDFYYKDGYVCVFCDGSVHDEPQQKEADQRIRTDLMNRGYRVVVIRYDRSLSDQVEENQDVFGVVRS